MITYSKDQIFSILVGHHEEPPRRRMEFLHSNQHTSFFPLWNVFCSGKWNPLHAGAVFHLINCAVEPFSLTPWGHVWKKVLPGSTFPVEDAVGWNIPIYPTPRLAEWDAGGQAESLVWFGLGQRDLARAILVYEGMQDFPPVEECLLRCDVVKTGDARTAVLFL